MLLRYIARRLLLLIPILLGVTLITFILTRAIPGDPIDRMVSPLASEDTRQQLIHTYGLDQPLWRQYFSYIDRLLHLDFGVSFTTSHSVLDDLTSRFMATFELTSYAMLLALILGLVLGVVAAVRRNSIVDHLARLFSVTGVAIPNFWLALVLIYLFFYLSHVMSAPAGRIDPLVNPPQQITGLYTIDALLTGNWTALASAAGALIVPVIVLAFPAMAPIARITRSSMIEALDADYARAARSLGIAERTVVLKYCLKNALLPVVTYAGIVYGFLLGGSVLVENIFAWPGLGQYAYNAISSADYPAVQGFILYATTVYIVIFLLLDILYVFLDPRIRYE
jgi:peptide/nickel transport system permease protein